MLRAKFDNLRLVWRGLVACGIILGGALPAAAATADELLEKGIYAEETVGDLKEAIEIYEKVLIEGKAAQSAAAQAQFRIGVCHAKQGNDKLATAAFEAVVENYPQETELVAKAKSRLPGAPNLLPVPWMSGEELHLEIQLPNGRPAGYQIWRVAEAEHEGRKAWRCQAWQLITLNGASGCSHVLVDADGFKPISSHWKHTLLGEADASYGDTQAQITLANNDEPVTIEYEGTVYDNEQGAEMFRRLPLKVGYKTKVDIISTLTALTVPLRIEVVGKESIKAPAGAFECFKIDLPDLKQQFWIADNDQKTIVQFAAGGIIARLVEVRHRKPDESIQFTGDGYSLTLPPNWHACEPSSSIDNQQDTILIGPEAGLYARVETASMEWINSEYDSPRGWLEAALERRERRVANYKLRGEGIEPINVEGQQGFSATFGGTLDGVDSTSRRTDVFGEKTAVNVDYVVPADKFAAFAAEVAKIIESLQVE